MVHLIIIQVKQIIQGVSEMLGRNSRVISLLIIQDVSEMLGRNSRVVSLLIIQGVSEMLGGNSRVVSFFFLSFFFLTSVYLLIVGVEGFVTLDHTHTHITFGRTPLDEGSA